MKIFSIDGYWKDDKSEFKNYLVSDSNTILPNDEEIFFYGLNEEGIKEAILIGELTNDEFVITNYKLYSINL